MRYFILCILLALTTCLYADEPKSKAIRKYENEVEVLRKQGQAAIKRLEGVFEKEVEKLREETLKDLQKELDAALEAKDLDKAVALRAAITAFEDAEAAGLSAKGEVATEKKVKKNPQNSTKVQRASLCNCSGSDDMARGKEVLRKVRRTFGYDSIM